MAEAIPIEVLRAIEDRALKLIENQPTTICLILLNYLRTVYARELRDDLSHAIKVAMRKEAVG